MPKRRESVSVRTSRRHRGAPHRTTIAQAEGQFLRGGLKQLPVIEPHREAQHVADRRDQPCRGHEVRRVSDRSLAVEGLVLTFIITMTFGRRCIPPRCVARRSHTPGMLSPRALRGGRLGARIRHRNYERQHLAVRGAPAKQLRIPVGDGTRGGIVWVRNQNAVETAGWRPTGPEER
jgi:hypothetical protein